MPRIGHFRLPANKKDKGVNIYTFVYYNRYHVYAQADKLWHYCTAACNIKCERTNTTSNDGYAFYRIYFFTINRAKTQ